jgi:KipI family sensor histidine kinase inhibitor
VGDAAVSVELGSTIEGALAARVRALDHALRADPPPGFLEALPTYRALLVVFDPLATSPGEVGRHVARLAEADRAEPPPRAHVVPTCYGGEAGPDLRSVAAATGLSEAEVVARHAGHEYTAWMLGFTPGFAYLGPVPPPLQAVPRRDTPRPRVPAGSVALATGQTAVYPHASPGGWQLLGLTALRLFDATADPPALIAPGDRVRFVPTGSAPSAPAPAAPAPRGPVEVVETGLLATVQDQGRFGCRRYGVGSGGAADPLALAAANRLVGNPPGAAGIEATGPGLALRFDAALHFALTGADLGAELERSDLGLWPVPRGQAVLARPGNVLRLRERRAGLRAWLAVEGGVAVARVLGSRATDLVGSFGGLAGRALRPGDRLPVGGERGAPSLAAWEAAPAAAVVTLRVVLGPQDDHFSEQARRDFLQAEYAVEATSDRVGCRLAGPPLAHLGAGEIVADGMLPGCVQVPPSGQPIVMGPDAPTTGGYPKIAAVVRADLPLLAQLVPGEARVRFAAVARTSEARP